MEENGVRINKFLSEAGVCSRREADRQIEAGKVGIDGVTAKTGDRVLKGQTVTYNGQVVSKEEEMILIALNKPAGIVCTAEKREKNNVIDYLNYPKRIYPIGRLDKDSEGLLAVKYRVIGKDGHSLGGPFYYIEQGMGIKWKWLAKIFAFFGVCVGLFGIGTFSQVNGISSAVNNFFDPSNQHTVKVLPFLGEYSWSVVIASLVLAFCVAAVLIGGVKRIANVSQVIVPFMAVIYIVFVLVLVVCNITEVPAAFATIVKAAFSPKAITGGAVGSFLVAMQKGVARGIFSNEAGLGSAPIAAAAAQTKEPVRQGLVSMTGTFIDTIVICTLTGLSIVLTGAWQVDGLEGVQVTTYAFQNGLPFPKELSAFVLMLCLVFFAFTTILGWDYYSERCLEYLSGGRMKYVKVYRWIYILAVFIGPYMTVSAVWTIADIFNGLMALPNMIALFALSGVVVKETKHFFERHKNGEIED